MVQKAASNARDERAERRASIHDTVAEAAHVSAGEDSVHAAAKQAQQALGSFTTGTTNIRVSTGHTPRVGRGDDTMMYIGVPGTSSGGQQAPPAPVQAAAPVPAVNPGDNGNGDGTGNDGGDDGGQNHGGNGDGNPGQAAQVPVGDGGAGQAAPAGQAAAVPPVPPAPLAPVPQLVYAVPPAPAWAYQPPAREKKLRLPKFKGLGEPKVSVKAWLKAVKNELRRQTAILRTEWREHEVFIEMVGSLEGEALMWYDTVEDSFSRREDQTFGNLSRLMKDRYMVKRSNPEVVARLRQRRQQRGESLVEYAQKLREIASSNPVDEEWLVDSFLSGMSNAWCATLVRGHRPTTLNEAVNSAVDQVGEYGEGYGVDLTTAMRAHDERTALTGTPSVLAGPDLARAQQISGGGSNLGTVVTGYDDVGIAAGPPPRYDVEGRLVLPPGGTPLQGGNQWNMVIPTGYRLVPEESATAIHGTSGNTNAQSAGKTHESGRKQNTRQGKALKLEGQNAAPQQSQQQRWTNNRNDEPLRTREDRLRNHQRYLAKRNPQQGTRAATSRADDMCFYCHGFGHHAHACELKKSDMEDTSPTVNQGAPTQHHAKNQRGTEAACGAGAQDSGQGSGEELDRRLVALETHAECRQQGKTPAEGQGKRRRKRCRSQRDQGYRVVEAEVTAEEERRLAEGNSEKEDKKRRRVRFQGTEGSKAGDGDTRTTSGEQATTASTCIENADAKDAGRDNDGPATTSNAEKYEAKETPVTTNTVEQTESSATDKGSAHKDARLTVEEKVDGGSILDEEEKTEAVTIDEQKPPDDVVNTGDGGAFQAVQTALEEELGTSDEVQAAAFRKKFEQRRLDTLTSEIEQRWTRRVDQHHARTVRRGQVRALRRAAENTTTMENSARMENYVIGAETAGATETTDGQGERQQDGDVVRVQALRSRRKYEKRVQKARAKERRELRNRDSSMQYPEGSYYNYNEHRRTGGNAKVLTGFRDGVEQYSKPSAVKVLTKNKQQKVSKAYEYYSGSTYCSPSVSWNDEADRPCRTGKLRAVQALSVDLLPTALVKVRGNQEAVKLDTGAQYSVAGRKWREWGTRLNSPPPVDFMEGFSGVAVRVLGVYRFVLWTQYAQSMTVDALIVDRDTEDFLIGEDWMYDQGVKIDFVSGEMKWYEDNTKKVVPFTGVGSREQREQRERVAKVRLMRKTKVRTQTCHNVAVAVPEADGTVGLFTPRSRKEPYLMVAPTLVTVHGGQVKVPILNLVGKNRKLPSRETLGTWTPVTDEMEILELDGELDRERVSQWLDELQMRKEPLSNEESLKFGDMDEKDKELLVKLLRNYPGLLEPKDGCPPATTLDVEHFINTEEAAPIKIRPRRYSQTEQEIIDKEVQSMLHDGVIEEGTGAWGFPVVLVRKKDGSVRFCIDYRLLNNITKKDIYPLPRIDEALDMMHGARRYSSLDLHAGYWQVPVASKDKVKTGFVTRQGLFQFVRMPFGLANAPGTFQRMMDAVLRGLTWKSCLVYLDDVIIFTKGSVSRHVVELACVLERLARAGLSLKAKKCSFAMTRLEYLGHELDEEGIRPLESLVDTVRKFPTPQNPDEVRRFVHLAGYYRRFVAHFGTKAAPMTKLLRKKTEWEWGPDQQKSFETLKAELTERPLLAYPDFSKSFKLVTDASVVGLGAALMQDQGAGDQPVAFASKVNSPTVAKYGITDLECAAVIWAVKLFRPYLYGRRFELVTDHSALSYLMKKKDLTGRPYRWALQLQEFDFSITYRPGSTNVVADALSRAPVRAVKKTNGPSTGKNVQQPEARSLRQSGSNGEDRRTGGDREPPEPRHGAGRSAEEEFGDTQLTDAEILHYQREDKIIRKLRERPVHEGRPVVIKSELVHVQEPDGSLRVVLPVVLRTKALREAHDSIYACHLRTPQTYGRLEKVYWWPGMRDQVKHWVRSCRDCATRKTKPTAVIPPLRSQGVGTVGDRWALDVAGPLPVTARGNRYVIAAVDYASRYAVMIPTPAHTADDIARFIMERIVGVYGPMREILMDGAPELNGLVVTRLVQLLQAKQTRPVAYRPMLLGLVERFHKVWKDMVSQYVKEKQDDWDDWIPWAAYAYNGAQHGTTGYSPNELMMGRRLRSPNELLRVSQVEEIRGWPEYHQKLVEHMATASTIAKETLAKDQLRRERYYNQKVRNRVHFKVGDRAWVFRPPRGTGVTKLAHQWVGPVKLIADVGFDNWMVVREDTEEELVVHCGFLTSYYCPRSRLETIADNILGELAQDEDLDDTPNRRGGATRNTKDSNGGDTVFTAPVHEPRTSGNDKLASDRNLPVGSDMATRATGIAVTGKRTDLATGTEDPGITREITDQGVTPVSNRQTQASVGNKQQTTDLSQTQTKTRASTEKTTPRKTRRPDARNRKRKASEVTRETVDSDGTTRGDGKRHRETDARAARAARRNTLRDQSKAPATEEVDSVTDRRLSGITEAGTDDAERGGGDRSQTTGIGGDDDEHRAVRTSERGEPDDDIQSVVDGAARALRGHGRSRWPSAANTIMEEATAGTVREQGQRKVRNKAGRYETEYRVEYQERTGAPIIRAWITAQDFERLLDEGKIGDDLLAGDGVWTR